MRPRYCKFDFSIRGSSQASSALHKNWKNVLNDMVIGDNMPSGLYILAATPTILRLVGLNLSKYSHSLGVKMKLVIFEISTVSQYFVLCG